MKFLSFTLICMLFVGCGALEKKSKKNERSNRNSPEKGEVASEVDQRLFGVWDLLNAEGTLLKDKELYEKATLQVRTAGVLIIELKTKAGCSTSASATAKISKDTIDVWLTKHGKNTEEGQTCEAKIEFNTLNYVVKSDDTLTLTNVAFGSATLPRISKASIL